jgi:hypothetical protein
MANYKCYRSIANPNQYVFSTRRGSISVVSSGGVHTITIYPRELTNKLGTMQECNLDGFNLHVDDAISTLVKILEATTTETFRTGNGITALLTDAKRNLA